MLLRDSQYSRRREARRRISGILFLSFVAKARHSEPKVPELFDRWTKVTHRQYADLDATTLAKFRSRSGALSRTGVDSSPSQARPESTSRRPRPGPILRRSGVYSDLPEYFYEASALEAEATRAEAEAPRIRRKGQEGARRQAALLRLRKMRKKLGLPKTLIDLGPAPADSEKGIDEDSNVADEEVLPTLGPDGTGFEGFPNHLDYGIYFFGPDNVPKKYRKGEANQFFSGTNDIMLYVHGWAGGAYRRGRIARNIRESFKHRGLGCTCDPEVDLGAAWDEKGWNKAVFYWDNFSDELLHTDAEAKIWTTESKVKMRYWSKKGGTQTEKSPTVPAAELLRQAIEDIMSERKDDNVKLRLVGHSLGAQMAIRASYLLAERVEQGLVPKSYLPTRIALLDPYWSTKAAAINAQKWLVDKRKWLGKDPTPESDPKKVSTASLSLNEARRLAELFGVLFEVYTSCPVLTEVVGNASPADELVRAGIAAQVRVSPAYANPLNFEGQHTSAFCTYLWSMTFDQTGCRTFGAPEFDDQAPTAVMPDQLLREARGSVWEAIWEVEPGRRGSELSSTLFRRVRPAEPRAEVAAEATHGEVNSGLFWFLLSGLFYGSALVLFWSTLRCRNAHSAASSARYEPPIIR